MEIKCVPETLDFDESMFDLIVFDCILTFYLPYIIICLTPLNIMAKIAEHLIMILF